MIILRRSLAVCAVGVLRGWRFARLAFLRGWRFARLAVSCGGRFKVGVLWLELSRCSFSDWHF